jgi:hypothetical protein
VDRLGAGQQWVNCKKIDVSFEVERSRTFEEHSKSARSTFIEARRGRSSYSKARRDPLIARKQAHVTYMRLTLANRSRPRPASQTLQLSARATRGCADDSSSRPSTARGCSLLKTGGGRGIEAGGRGSQSLDRGICTIAAGSIPEKRHLSPTDGGCARSVKL